VIAVGGKVIGYIPGYLNEQGYDSGRGFILLSLILPQSLCGAAAVLLAAAAALAVYFFGDPLRPWRGAVVMTGLTLFLTTPGYSWYAVLLCAFVALDGSVEWLSLALTGYIAQIGITAGLSSLAAQRTGYVVAAAVVGGGWVLRERRRRGRLEGDTPGASVTAGPALIPAAHPEPLVDVVLPCLDEAAALPYLLGRLPDGYRAIVVDNGSTDGSAEIAAGLGAHVVTESRKGFGAACHAGLVAASAPVVCFCDCDGSFDPEQLPRVADPVLLGACATSDPCAPRAARPCSGSRSPTGAPATRSRPCSRPRRPAGRSPRPAWTTPRAPESRRSPAPCPAPSRPCAT
jgi:hypothetical protein